MAVFASVGGEGATRDDITVSEEDVESNQERARPEWLTDYSLHMNLIGVFGSLPGSPPGEDAEPVELSESDAPPRLREATPEQPDDVQLIGRGIGIHWPQLDEDLSVRGLLWRLAPVARSCRSWDLPSRPDRGARPCARTLSRAPHWNQTRFHGFDPRPRGRTSRREAPYPREKPRTLREETLDVGAFDFGHPKVERPSLRVTCGAGGLLRVGVAVDDGHRSTRKRLGERSEQAD